MKAGMQKITLGTTGRETTRLGYGCSSIMGAMGRKASLAILDAAFDAGVRHFDVAPMYGFGEAEKCLGEFLRQHPGQVTVTTKYGIPPTGNSSLLGIARNLARPLIKRLPGLKKRLADMARNVEQKDYKQPPATFTPEAAKQSLERSLTALGTDHIDLWLLHEVEAESLGDDSLLRLLEDLVASGKIGAFGIGSEGIKIANLLTLRPQYCRTLQYEWSVLDRPIPASTTFRIHHRALTQHFRSLHAALLRDPKTLQRWSDATGADLRAAEMLAQLMLKAALTMNPDSIILFSSKRPEHIRANVLVADNSGLAVPAARLYDRVQAEQADLLASPALAERR